jgi:hypothetical protein
MLDLRLSQHWLWRVLYSGLWSCAVWFKFPDVSEEHTTFMFRIKEWAKQASACFLLLTAYLLGLYFNLEGEGSTFLWNVAELQPDYAVSHPRRESLEMNLDESVIMMRLTCHDCPRTSPVMDVTTVGNHTKYSAQRWLCSQNMVEN